MEQLLHYVWQHRLFPLQPLTTTDGMPVEVIDPGLHNTNDGPDFFNAKVKIGGTTWVGNVEIHLRASDWARHRHHTDPHYNNVILHVASCIDTEVQTLSGQTVPQLRLSAPPELEQRYRQLLEEEAYPPCYRAIPHLPQLTVHAWMSALTVERLEQKTERIEGWLKKTAGDWERTCFITLARNFGFGINADTFEQWAERIEPSAVGKHRDNPFQVEAFFFGQAGLLSDEAVPPERRDDHFRRLQAEYAFLKHKFTLTPIAAESWRFMRLRPHNFPHVRLSQLVELYCSRRLNFSRLREADGIDALRLLLHAQATPYWQEHYAFGTPAKPSAKALQKKSIDLLIINTVAPLLFAYGRQHFDEELAERAFDLLATLPAEQNFITRSWQAAGIDVANAADSQAIIQLKRAYCDRHDCLRCRFGAEYLRRKTPTTN